MATSGFIANPGYPIKYNNNLNCSWIIRVQDAHYVTYSFLDLSFIGSRFSLGSNCTDDYVEIREFNSTGNACKCLQRNVH